MKLVVLGSGTSVPHPHRSSAGYWLESEQGTVLLDIGADAPHRMAHEGLDWPNLDAIWISHFHLDHIAGLAPFLFGARWAPQMRHRQKGLRVHGPWGLIPLIEKTNDANNYGLLEQNFPVELIEHKADQEFEMLPGLKAKTFSTPHTPESLALRLTAAQGKTIVYTSDTGFSEKLIEFAKDASLLLLECSFRRNKPLPEHLELADAMLIVKACRPRTVVLTHLSPEWDVASIEAEARTFWPGKLLEAVDGLRLEF